MPSAAPTRARRVATVQDFADIEAYGVDGGLANWRLRSGRRLTGRSRSRRVFIPKANGKRQAAGHLDRADQVCMTAAMLVLEPIFEADFHPEIYAYRAGRNAQQAVVEVEELLFRGHPNRRRRPRGLLRGIHLTDLLKSVARQIIDRRVLHLIKMWLDCPVEEIDQREGGRNVRLRPGTTGAAFRRAHPSHHCWQIFTCAGLCWEWKKLGLEQILGTRLVTYGMILVRPCRRAARRQPCTICARSWVS